MNKNFIPPNKDEFETALRLNKSTKDLCVQFNISRSTLFRYVKEYGLDGIRKIPNSSVIKFKCNEEFFFKNTPDSFYISGFIAADGCILDYHQNKNRNSALYIGLQLSDKQHLEKIKLLIGAENPIGEIKTKSAKVKIKVLSGEIKEKILKEGERCQIKITSTKLCEGLLRFGITPRKTYTYEIPEWVANHELFSHFCRGIVDGDGCISICGKNTPEEYLRFNIVGTKNVCETLLKTFIKNCNLQNINRKISKNTGCYRLDVAGDKETLRIANYLYKNSENSIFLERKYNNVLATINKRKIKSDTRNQKINVKIEKFIESSSQHFDKQEFENKNWIENKKLLQKMYNECGSLKIIAEVLQIEFRKLKEAFIKHEIKLRVYKKEIDEKELLELCKQNKLVSEIAKYFNCSEITISRTLRKYKINKRLVAKQNK